MNLYFNSSEKLFKRAFSTDLNRFSSKDLIKFNLNLDLIRNGREVKDFLEKFCLNNRKELNQFLNNLVLDSLNRYFLWSDKVKLDKYFKPEKYFEPDDKEQPIYPNLIDCYKKPLRKVVVTFLYTNSKSGLKIRGFNNFEIEPKALEDLKKINDLNDAKNFLNVYGLDYPYCQYCLKDYKVYSVEVCSYNIQDKKDLESIGEELLELLTKNVEFDSFMFGNQKTLIETKENKGKYQFKAEFLLKGKKLGPFYKYENIIPNDPEVIWYPIWRLLDQSKNRNQISDKIIFMIRDMHFIKHKSFECLTRIFQEDTTLYEKLIYSKGFIFSCYWEESVMSFIEKEYIDLRNGKFYDQNLTPNALNSYTDEMFINSQFEKTFLVEKKTLVDIVSNERIFYLPKVLKFEDFIEDKLRKYNFVILYYSRELINKYSNNWTEIFKAFSRILKQQSQSKSSKKVCGLLVDFQVHPEVRALGIEEEYFYYEYLFESEAESFRNRKKFHWTARIYLMQIVDWI